MNKSRSAKVLVYFTVIVDGLASDAESICQPGLNRAQLNRFDHKNPSCHFIEKIDRFDMRTMPIQLCSSFVAGNDPYPNPFSEVNTFGGS